jgi:DNA-directed RNA polymerase subunit RPC12/RpoP
LGENSDVDKTASAKNRNACPQCGHELSPWQQVLLNIDRALVCKSCWYRIILDISEDEDISPPSMKS